MPSRRTNNRRRPGGQQAQRRTAPRPVPQTPPVDEAAPEATGGTGGPAVPNQPTVQMQLGPTTATKPRATPAPAPAPTAAQRVQAQRRAVRTRPPRGIQIGDDDPGIPLDKVPYFTSDLIRLGITALIMIILLVVGAKLLVPHLIT
jgi:hypothetical protein